MEQGTEELAAMSRGEVLREKSAKWEGRRAKRKTPQENRHDEHQMVHVLTIIYLVLLTHEQAAGAGDSSTDTPPRFC